MFVKSPAIIKKVFPDLVWDIKTSEKEIYLTFDDGPHPEITRKVIELLDKYDAKATFFCVGENVMNYPNTFKLIIGNGHQAGNHSYNHINGWKVSNHDYFENIEKADQLINSHLFRPPFGRIMPSQIKALKEKYSIIMWSVLTYDFDMKVNQEKCLKNSIRATKPGSIIIFHDSKKAEKNLLYALPVFLQHFYDKGFAFKLL
ncbi:MAG: polysaccharide deacetylase family protein [Bacteroidetes bacterium]|nr:polysaccharide deacetylase family protein [Bacteroidota bacterium]MBL6943549.1 polysaccharide deacetylase family protein [Bacteroidales bacterium]